MQTAQVSQAAFAWLERSERIGEVVERLTPTLRNLLLFIYACEERGVQEEEVTVQMAPLDSDEIRHHLRHLEHEVLIYSREGDYRTYHGFEEFGPYVLEHGLKEKALRDGEAAQAQWMVYAHFLKSHLAHFLAQTALGNVKVTQGGELHRKDLQSLAGRFSLASKLSPAAGEEEAVFLYRFAAETRAVKLDEGRLHLSTQGREIVEGDSPTAVTGLLDWWLEKRTGGLRCFLQVLASLEAGTVFRIGALADLIWAYGGVKKKNYAELRGGITWENLPKPLQELWLLGFLDFGMAKGRIQFARLNLDYALPLIAPSGTEDVPAVEPSGSGPIGLPNLECLVPVMLPLTSQYRVELCSDRENDEILARHRFTKKSVVQGLQVGLKLESFKELISWLGFDPSAQGTLLEWANTYASTYFLDALVLKVSDTGRLGELMDIPEFLALTREVIPGFGFIVEREQKDKVRDLLGHLGLIPGEDPRRILHLQPVSTDMQADTWKLPKLDYGDFRYSEADIPKAPRKGPKKPLPSEAAQAGILNPEEKITLVESALETGSQLELKLGDKSARVVVSPILLIKHRNPAKIIGIEKETGHRNEYVLDQIRFMRTLKK